MIEYEFKISKGFNFIDGFGEKFDVPVFGDHLIIPDKLGKGYIKYTNLGEGFKVVTHNYTLKQDFIMKRRGPDLPHNLVSFLFYLSEPSKTSVTDQQKNINTYRNTECSVQLASHDLHSDTYFRKDSRIYFMALAISKERLVDLLELEGANNVVNTVLHGKNPIFYQEKTTAEIRKILKYILDSHEQSALKRLYFKIKIIELLYLLFTQLLKRGNIEQTSINNVDVETLMQIRKNVLADLSIQPQLSELSSQFGISKTKMIQLFKQMYGDSIYSYYQSYRMEEAAFMLKHLNYSVSETGYQLGFSNLGHFSRLFKKHFDSTPKKYSSVT